MPDWLSIEFAVLALCLPIVGFLIRDRFQMGRDISKIQADLERQKELAAKVEAIEAAREKSREEVLQRLTRIETLMETLVQNRQP